MPLCPARDCMTCKCQPGNTQKQQYASCCCGTAAWKAIKAGSPEHDCYPRQETAPVMVRVCWIPWSREADPMKLDTQVVKVVRYIS